MARGDHPQRTPFYGGLLMIFAMIIGTLVSVWTHPGLAVRVPVLSLALIIAIVGLGMTLRDRTPRR